MRKYCVFAIFAAAILFSMVREWSAPVSCLRTALEPLAVAAQRSHQYGRSQR
jgi:hypothetical protein